MMQHRGLSVVWGRGPHRERGERRLCGNGSEAPVWCLSDKRWALVADLKQLLQRALRCQHLLTGQRQRQSPHTEQLLSMAQSYCTPLL